MPIQTNIPLTSTSNLPVPAGSYCVLDIHIDTRKFFECTMIFYKDKTTYDNKTEAPFFPNTPNLEPRFLHQLNDAEYAEISNVNIHLFIQAHLETFFGPGTTELVQ